MALKLVDLLEGGLDFLRESLLRRAAAERPVAANVVQSIGRDETGLVSERRLRVGLVVEPGGIDYPYSRASWASCSGKSKPVIQTAMGWQEYRALALRSKALNAKYGLGGAHGFASTPRAVTVAENGFVWDDFAIGAAGMLGLVPLATGVFAASRRIPRTRVSS